jgi:hypothetical protein
MKQSVKGKKNRKAPVAEPAAEVEQKPKTEVTGQAEPRGETALNEVEELKLNEYDRVVEQNLNGFMLVGRALAAIRAEKLYRAKFGSFEEYCRERWGLSDKHAYRLIEAYTCVDKLQKELVSPIGETRFPIHESQVRPLTPLVPEKQVKAWQRVLKACEGKPITADEVQNVVDKMQGQPGKMKATKPKTGSKKAEQKLVKIDELVTEALEEDESKLTIAGLKKILEKIQKMIGAKK